MSAVGKIKLTCQVKIASEEMKNVERWGEKREHIGCDYGGNDGSGDEGM
jgi:hypothetical protein